MSDPTPDEPERSDSSAEGGGDPLPKVVILGGGMGALATAWSLSQPGWRDRFESVTVYQRGWRLGGKGATGRGPDDRVEEHGLHVLLGYYHNTFDLLGEVYRELDREHTDPDCPIRDLEDMLIASPRVGVTDLYDGQWSTWTAAFSIDGTVPGRADRPTAPMSIVELARRALTLLLDFSVSTIGAPSPTDADDEPHVRLDLGPDDPPAAPFGDWFERAGTLGTRGVLSLLAGALEAIVAVQRDGRRWFRSSDPFVAFVSGPLDVAHDHLRRLTVDDEASRRFFQLADIIVTILRGLAAEGVFTNPSRLRLLNDVDFRAWLTEHGADPVTVESPLIRGVYDLAFAYRDGDPDAPAFPAGLGIYLSGRMFFDYQGSIFWKMRCGMGDAIFAPMYQALRRRGVEFRFFHSLQNIEVGAGRRIEAIELRRQADLPPGSDRYEPLVRVKDLPAWPAAPVCDRLDTTSGGSADSDELAGSEALWGDPPGSTPVILRAGEDFDIAVLGVSLGMVPHVCRELIEANPRWRAMVDNVGTVATQAMQLWLDPTEPELGWHDADVTISGYVEPFDTWASMNHVLEHESWPRCGGPQTLAYFCNALQTRAPASAAGQRAAEEQVRLNAIHFLDRHVGLYWPRAVRLFPDRFDWSLLHAPDTAQHVERLDAQYLRANLDPSDRYVQALPGSSGYRIRPDETGYDNLFVAGDWTDTGLNAGCLEAAVISGMLAANAINDDDRQVDIAALRELREYFG